MRARALGVVAVATMIGLSVAPATGAGAVRTAAATAVDTAVSPPVAIAGSVNRSSRADVRSAYLNHLKPLFNVPIGWTGNVDGCSAGKTSTAAHKATLDAVNFYRQFVGMDPVTFDPAYDAKAQAAALMMRANDDLDHHPPSTWKCWSDDGAAGAGSSNLALGSGGARAIGLYMADAGSSNTEVGHRRWVLNSYADAMGSGSTDATNALYVIAPELDSPTGPAQWGWPTEGFFPREMEPGGRWSFSGNGIDFDSAIVRVTGPGGTLNVTQHPVAGGYGDDTIVWNVSGLSNSSQDVRYNVSIDGLERGGQPLEVSYDVVLFTADPPTPPPPTPKPLPPPPPPPPNRLPVGGMVLSLTDGRGYGLLGWAIDPDTNAPTRMRVVIPGVVIGEHDWNHWWDDMPRYTGTVHHESLVFLTRLPPGEHSVCFDALDANGGGWVRLACRTHTVK